MIQLIFPCGARARPGRPRHSPSLAPVLAAGADRGPRHGRDAVALVANSRPTAQCTFAMAFTALDFDNIIRRGLGPRPAAYGAGRDRVRESGHPRSLGFRGFLGAGSPVSI